jgi:hypothetical protein
MKRSHKPRSEANPRSRAKEEALTGSSSHQAEGPAVSRAPEVVPSGSAPTARESQEPPGSPPSPFLLQAFDLDDADHVHAWVDAMRDAIADLAAAAREGTRRLRYRVLSRAEIRRQARSAERSLTGLLEAAESALMRRITRRD